MKRVAALVLLSLSLVACDSERTDPLAEFASASCAALQQWIDAIEDEATALSRHVTPLEDAADRVVHYRDFTKAADLRTWDTIRQLKRIAPAHGDGRIAGDALVAAMESSRGVTQELIELTDSFPVAEDDESLTGRISSIFVRLEKAFAFPNQTRDDLAHRFREFDDVPSCADYTNPVS